ncbi:unnamed protein product [Pleuronectes platessa]|uniref:Uncharacterized protein n=1 Tax=Pleuronectes platessa TaxID=8262 RepID=A0A9N7VEW3_PLEPL|nr:unnamed protein product [Pleuronectes platessa]
MTATKEQPSQRANQPQQQQQQDEVGNRLFFRLDLQVSCTLSMHIAPNSIGLCKANSQHPPNDDAVATQGGRLIRAESVAKIEEEEEEVVEEEEEDCAWGRIVIQPLPPISDTLKENSRGEKKLNMRISSSCTLPRTRT